MLSEFELVSLAKSGLSSDDGTSNRPENDAVLKNVDWELADDCAAYSSSFWISSKIDSKSAARQDDFDRRKNQ